MCGVLFTCQSTKCCPPATPRWWSSSATISIGSSAPGVLTLARRLNEIGLDGIIETVPTFRSLMVYYDPLTLPTAALAARIVELMRGLTASEETGRTWRLPACYDELIAPDLADVAARTGLTPAQVVECHSATVYHVYMLGFMPGMAYLGDVPSELVLPRRETPRLKVPAGSLAIASTMTCVYPLETPAGWHLIGRSPVPFCSGGRVPPHWSTLATR